MFKYIGLLILICSAGFVQADNSSAQKNSTPYSFSGVFQGYDKDTQTITVDATKFKLASDVVVYLTKLNYGSIENVKTNSPVGLGIGDEGTIPRTVDAIWLLPKSSAAQR